MKILLVFILVSGICYSAETSKQNDKFVYFAAKGVTSTASFTILDIGDKSGKKTPFVPLAYPVYDMFKNVDKKAMDKEWKRLRRVAKKSLHNNVFRNVKFKGNKKDIINILASRFREYNYAKFYLNIHPKHLKIEIRLAHKSLDVNSSEFKEKVNELRLSYFKKYRKTIY